MRYQLVTPVLLHGLKGQAQSAEVEQGREAALLVRADVLVQLIERIQELEDELQDEQERHYGRY